ncbi:MAG: AAA family ATPase [Phycisphaerae bacterium]|nr:AAA family ATPase [Phycisphaerae bacterium]
MSDPFSACDSSSVNGECAARGSAQKRLTQVFKFLKELDELRNPVTRDMSSYDGLLWIDRWPAHPTLVVQRGDAEDEGDPEEEVEVEPVIRIRRPRLTRCPEPPDALDGWLKPGWQSAESQVEVLESRNSTDSEGITTTTRFDDSEQRMATLDGWKALRSNWAAAERPAIEAMAVFEQVHALWATMQREGDRKELLLADGMLSVPEAGSQHSVLMERVDLEFDPSGPEFHFTTGTQRAELNRALLRNLPGVDVRMIAQLDKELDSQPVDPLGGESATGFFRRLVQGLFTDGEYVDQKPRGSQKTRASIWREPVVFLRPRTAGLRTTLDAILEHLSDQEAELPAGLSQIVGIDPCEAAALPIASGDGDKRLSLPAPAPDILFSKPANDEQYEIAERLERSKAVLVQGPPGTGKTHTIANLLGHLLAQGKTVLVTAHTTKALRVLRGKVDKALQPLCLSVLEGDAENSTQLSRAAHDIVDRLSSAHSDGLRRAAANLRQRRRKLLETRALLRRQLRDARFSEIEEVVFGGDALGPIEVAKRVKDGAERDAWVPGPIKAGAACPLPDGEVRQLYASQGTLLPEDETELAVSQPELKDLVLPRDFALLAAERAGTDNRAAKHRPDLWAEGITGQWVAANLQTLHQRVVAGARVLAEQDQWLREVLYAGWMGGDHRGTWEDLMADVEALAKQAATVTRLERTYAPELPDTVMIDDAYTTLREIVAHLESGGRLGIRTKLTRRGWHQLIDACRVEGRVPRTLEEVHALLAFANLRINRRQFAGRWQRGVESVGGPPLDSLGKFPERAASGYCGEIRNRLDWRDKVWEPLVGELRQAGFLWDDWLSGHPTVVGDHGELARVERAVTQGLPEIVEGRVALLRQAELTAALESQRSYLARFPLSEPALLVLSAQDAWDVETYEQAYREIARLDGLRPTYEGRLASLAKVDVVAQNWAGAIRARKGPHDLNDPPGDPTAAWRWRQWHQELERRAAVSISELQDRLEQAEQELRGLAAQIVECET